MSKYTGLDKIDVKGLKFIETYNGKKIYQATDDDHPGVSNGFLVVSQGYLVDCQLCDIEGARSTVDYFNEV